MTIRWSEMSRVNKIATLVTIVLFLATFAAERFGSEDAYGALLVVGIVSLLVVFALSSRDLRRSRRALRNEFVANSARHPWVFREPARLTAPEEIADDARFQLYELESGRRVGDVPGRDLKRLIQTFERWGFDRNDFFLLPESLEVMKGAGLSAETEALLRQATENGEVELRWWPA